MDPGRNRPKTPECLRKMTVRTLPRTPRGRGDKSKIKSVLKYSWVDRGDFLREATIRSVPQDRVANQISLLQACLCVTPLQSQGVQKTLRKGLELVYPVENRCTSSGASAGAFPRHPRGRVGPRSGSKSTISGPTSKISVPKNLTEWHWNWSAGLRIGANRGGPNRNVSQGPPRGRV